MKKLMIAAAIVCAAACVQAGTIQWGSGWLNAAGQPGEGDVYGGTVYLINADASTFFTAALANFDTAVGTYAINSATQVDDALSAPMTGTINDSGLVEWDPGAGSYSLFMAAKDVAGNLYISEGYSRTVPGGIGSASAEFTHDFAYDPGTVHDASKGYAGAGWYTTAVPEPTSGLLLLLGVAGLALRRRRA